MQKDVNPCYTCLEYVLTSAKTIAVYHNYGLLLDPRLADSFSAHPQWHDYDCYGAHMACQQDMLVTCPKYFNGLLSPWSEY